MADYNQLKNAAILTPGTETAVSTAGGYRIYIWTSSGSITF
jgi:hypothetical protein